MLSLLLARQPICLAARGSIANVFGYYNRLFPSSYDSWPWKAGLQALADEFQLTITVTHFPTGASKWNPIEHRMFSPISQNWAGQPLVSYETMLKFIRTTRTETGFHCRARLDTATYTGRKITPEEKAQINLQPRRVFPEWN
jgi:hypothetical protein